MASRSLAQTVMDLLNPETVSSRCESVNYVTTQVTTQELAHMLTDEPLRTITDVTLWIITTNTYQPEIYGDYSVVIDSDQQLAGAHPKVEDVKSITISGTAGEICTVCFYNRNISSVLTWGESIMCNNLLEHEGGFILRVNTREVGYVSFW